MAYTIELEDKKSADRFIKALESKTKKDGRFKVGRVEAPEAETLGVRARGKRAPRCRVVLRYIRLVKSKPYCGQHPGECVVGPLGPRPKPVLKCLEWDDWIAFNDLVNDVLDALGAPTQVWSVPREPPLRGQSKRKFWIRKDNKRRTQWDWEPEWDRGREIRRWDMGSESQFAEAP